MEKISSPLLINEQRQINIFKNIILKNFLKKKTSRNEL